MPMKPHMRTWRRSPLSPFCYSSIAAHLNLLSGNDNRPPGTEPGGGLHDRPLQSELWLIRTSRSSSSSTDYDWAMSEWTADRTPADGLLSLPLEDPGVMPTRASLAQAADRNHPPGTEAGTNCKIGLLEQNPRGKHRLIMPAQAAQGSVPRLQASFAHASGRARFSGDAHSPCAPWARQHKSVLT